MFLGFENLDSASTLNQSLVAPSLVLIYMSIVSRVRSLVGEGRLFQIEPLDSSLEVRRVMVVSGEIQELLNGPWSNDALQRRANRLRADLEAFVIGQIISVSMTPYKAGKAYMGLLDPPERGFWDIRSRDPNPGLRVLGHFAETDLFVSLVWHPRSVEFAGRPPLGDTKEPNWELAKLQCEEQWQDLFPGHTAKIGDTIDDLISEDKFLV